jgi:long-chain fatty acid transport protein
VYGNDGMNTTYLQGGGFNCGAGPANMLCGSGTLGVDLTQLIVAPTLAYRINAQHALGVSLLLGYPQFKAMGLQAFDNAPGFPPFTDAPGSVTDNGHAKSHGLGIRVGYQGHISDTVTIGAAYAPKMSMGRFEKCKGLFAGSGKFDIPSNFNLGVAFTPTPAVTVALDYERINCSAVPAVSKPSAAQAPPGAANGPGFGWKAVNVFKLGRAWSLSDALSLRVGFDRSDDPIRPADVTFNILAPGAVTNHHTAGLTYGPDKQDEVSGMLMVAPRQNVTGASLFNAVLGPGAGGNETIGNEANQRRPVLGTQVLTRRAPSCTLPTRATAHHP